MVVLAVNMQGNVSRISSQIRAPLMFTDVNAVREQLRLLNSTTNVTGITIEVDVTTGTCHLYIVNPLPNSVVVRAVDKLLSGTPVS